MFHRPRILFLAVLALLSTLLMAVPAPPADAAPTPVAGDMSPTGSTNLISYTTNAPAFSSLGDGFTKFQRGVSSSIPFALVDDTLQSFPGDLLGIVDDNDFGVFFGVVDTQNGDNSGPVTANWVFDISGQSNLAISIDMAAMGDFEAADSYEWAYSIDDGAAVPLFSLQADEADSRTYVLASGVGQTLDDPLNVGAVQLSNLFQPVGASIAGTGNELSLSLTVVADGGSEAVAFRNIVISADDGPGGPTPGDLVVTEIMQNPSVVPDGAGEWVEIANVSATDIDIEGWTISDRDIDTHVIANGAPLNVPAGGYVVLGVNDSSGINGGVAVDYSYGSGFFLSNGSDEFVLTNPDGVEFDAVEWDNGTTFPDPSGASMNLHVDATDTVSNDDGSNWCEASAIFGLGDRGTPGRANTDCDTTTAALIHEIQGSNATVAISGPVVIEAVVTSLFERDDVLDGFFVQEEDHDADSDSTTSEGIFVFCRTNCPAALAVGDLVEVAGSATDFFGMSQIDMSAGTATVMSANNPLPSASPLSMPAPAATTAESTFENLEGMIVTIPDTMVVSEYFQLGRFGQVVLTEESRPFQFTHLNEPSVAGYGAYLADLATRRIILDDDNNDNNDAISDGPDETYAYPAGGLAISNKFRGGDTITGLTGVLHWSFAGSGGTDAWRIRPIDGVANTFVSTNPEPAHAPDVGGSMTVATFNVLNYFATVDVGSDICGPLLQGCRGADSDAERLRQRDKIVSAIGMMDADVVGLVELENDGDDASIAQLVEGLNATLGANTYDYIATGYIGADAIKVGFIYQPARVAPVGEFVVLDDSVDPTFVEAKNRPALIQTFAEISSGERVTVAVNHLKSKGSSCADVGDPGLNDGQANCPLTRAAGAAALANYLSSDPTGSGDPDFLIIGDLNSYAMEAAIAALVDVGYTDLLDLFGGPGAYSYVFDGQLGYLDHALANSNLIGQVTGAAAWAINADEVNLFDYNDAVHDPGERSFERESNAAPIYDSGPTRSSDHDPVIVGLALDSIPEDPECGGQAATIIGTPGDDSITGTDGPDVIATFGGNDYVDGLDGADIICTGFGDDEIDGSGGRDIVDAGHGNDLIRGGDGKDEILGGEGSDALSGGEGKDLLDGGAGEDSIDGGAGNDTCVDGELLASCEF